MSAAQGVLFGPPPLSQARRHDPASARRAAAENPEGRQSQAARILRWLWEHGTITADTAWRQLTVEGEDVTRGEWSTRIGVLCSTKGGRLVERAGLIDERGRRGRVRKVLAYRLTEQGQAECQLMFRSGQ